MSQLIVLFRITFDYWCYCWKACFENTGLWRFWSWVTLGQTPAWTIVVWSGRPDPSRHLTFRCATVSLSEDKNQINIGYLWSWHKITGFCGQESFGQRTMTVLSIAQTLKISKIRLFQNFSKRIMVFGRVFCNQTAI